MRRMAPPGRTTSTATLCLGTRRSLVPATLMPQRSAKRVPGRIAGPGRRGGGALPTRGRSRPGGYSASVITQRCAIPAEKAKAEPRVRKTSSTTRTVRASRPAAPP